MLEFRLLGSVDLRRPSGEVLQSVLVQPKRVALLAYLAIAQPRGFQRRDTLLALFWPELDDDHARGSLRNSLYRLRSYVGEDIIVGRGSEEIAVSQDLWCDVVAFEEAVAAGKDAEAMALYRGDLLAGFFITDVSPEFEQWVAGERQRLRGLATQAAWRLADAAAARDDRVHAAEWAQRAVQLAPTDEQGVRKLMRLLYQHRDRAGAIAVYDKLAEHLSRDFNVEPDAETQQLVAAIRAQATHANGEYPALPDLRPDAALHAGARKRLMAAVAATAIITAGAFVVWQLATSRNDAAASSTATRGQLNTVSTCCEFPIGRTHASGAMDSKRNTLIVFGGRLTHEAFNDLWALDGAGRPTAPATWTRWQPGGTPPSPRWGHSAVYDSVSDRMIVFGGALGFSAPCRNDLYLLTNASGRHGERRWEQVVTSHAPPPRAEHTTIYDEKTNRLILFGGHDCIAPRFNDVWVLHDANGATATPRWERVNITHPEAGPRGRSAHAAVYDPVGGRMLIIGGQDGDGTNLGGVWALQNANGGPAHWRALVTGDAQTERAHHLAAYDAVRDWLMIAAGSTMSGGTAGDAWVLEGTRDGKTTWRELGPFAGESLSRMAAAFGYNPKSGNVVLFGGLRSGAIYQDALTLSF